VTRTLGGVRGALRQLLAEPSTRFISITSSENYITVHNLKSPLLSRMESTGLGHKNIMERYALLCDKKVKIENTENFYSVSLPIIKNIMTHENIGS